MLTFEKAQICSDYKSPLEVWHFSQTFHRRRSIKKKKKKLKLNLRINLRPMKPTVGFCLCEIITDEAVSSVFTHSIRHITHSATTALCYWGPFTGWWLQGGGVWWLKYLAQGHVSCTQAGRKHFQCSQSQFSASVQQWQKDAGLLVFISPCWVKGQSTVLPLPHCLKPLITDISEMCWLNHLSSKTLICQGIEVHLTFRLHPFLHQSP